MEITNLDWSLYVGDTYIGGLSGGPLGSPYNPDSATTYAFFSEDGTFSAEVRGEGSRGTHYEGSVDGYTLNLSGFDCLSSLAGHCNDSFQYGIVAYSSTSPIVPLPPAALLLLSALGLLKVFPKRETSD
jgi:hypothetical protein